MTHIRKLRLVLPARFAAQGGSAAREIAQRLVDASQGSEAGLEGRILLQDTGQTASQIGLQAAQRTQGRTPQEGDGS